MWTKISSSESQGLTQGSYNLALELLQNFFILHISFSTFNTGMERGMNSKEGSPGQSALKKVDLKNLIIHRRRRRLLQQSTCSSTWSEYGFGFVSDSEKGLFTKNKLWKEHWFEPIKNNSSFFPKWDIKSCQSLFLMKTLWDVISINRHF